MPKPCHWRYDYSSKFIWCHQRWYESWCVWLSTKHLWFSSMIWTVAILEIPHVQYRHTYWALDIFFYCLKIQWTSNIVSGDDYIFIVCVNKVCHNVQFNVFQSSVNVYNISAWIFNEAVSAIGVHENDDLFS